MYEVGAGGFEPSTSRTGVQVLGGYKLHLFVCKCASNSQIGYSLTNKRIQVLFPSGNIFMMLRYYFSSHNGFELSRSSEGLDCGIEFEVCDLQVSIRQISGGEVPYSLPVDGEVQTSTLSITHNRRGPGIE